MNFHEGLIFFIEIDNKFENLGYYQQLHLTRKTHAVHVSKLVIIIGGVSRLLKLFLEGTRRRNEATFRQKLHK